MNRGGSDPGPPKRAHGEKQWVSWVTQTTPVERASSFSFACLQALRFRATPRRSGPSLSLRRPATARLMLPEPGNAPSLARNFRKSWSVHGPASMSRARGRPQTRPCVKPRPAALRTGLAPTPGRGGVVVAAHSHEELICEQRAKVYRMSWKTSCIRPSAVVMVFALA